MRPLAFLVAFLLLAPTAHAKPPRVNGLAWIGGLALHFDASRWQVNGAGTRYDLYCTTYDCARTTVSVAIVDRPNACTEEALAFDDRDSRFPGYLDTFTHDGLTFHIAEADIGCRNLAGGPVRACTSYGGKTYMFDAPGRACRTHPGAAARLNEILRGLRPR